MKNIHYAKGMKLQVISRILSEKQYLIEDHKTYKARKNIKL